MVTCFSNFSSTTDIFAPGCRATSTYLANGTITFCGTSMASPASAACAALLLEENPSLTSDQVESRLETSPVSVNRPGSFLFFPRIDCSVPAPTPAPCPMQGCPTPTATPDPFINLLYPSNMDGGISDVAVSGDTVIFGGHTDDAAGTDAGVAFIFRRDHGGAGNWGEVKKIFASDATSGYHFGLSVAIDGDTAVVGMWQASGTTPGAVYVFQRDEGGVEHWGEVQKITSLDEQNGDSFGYSVAISGDTIIAGAKHYPAASSFGAAFVFQRDEGGADNWGQVKKLISSDIEVADFFGHSVGVSGDTAVVGAHGEDSGGFAAGAAYVFHRDQGGANNWGEVKKLTASDAEELINFGFEVAISGDNALIGIYDSNSPYVVKAYVFQRDQGGADTWGEAKKLSAPPGPGGQFGLWVAIDGNTAVISSPAHVFQANAGLPNNWGEIYEGELTEARGGPGAISGDTVVVSPYLSDLAYVVVLGGDADGDGCSDQQEHDPDETLGGQRDPTNPWDFYDVLGAGGGPPDGVIDLPNDILGVIQHFSADGKGGYGLNFDRGPSAGPNPWNMTAPDGVIDLPNDILGVILQFNHSCQ